MNKIKLLSLFLLASFLLVSCRQKTAVRKENIKKDSTTKEIKTETGNDFLWKEYGFTKYHNARFDFCVWYPSKVLVPRGESENGDGESFISDDMKFRMIVSGVFNIEKLDISKVYQKDYDFYSTGSNFHLTLHKKKDNYYVISGYNGGNIFYTKTFIVKDKLITIYFEYTPLENDIYNKLVEEILVRFPGC